MLAKIIIKRKFTREGAKDVLPLLTKMRSRAMNQPGYVSGETLTDFTNQQSVAVIATWESMEDWLNWKENPERKNIEAMLEVFQLGPTVYEEYILGAFLPK